MSQDDRTNDTTQPGQQPAPVPSPDETAAPKKRKLSLDIDQVDISEKLERKISA